MHIPLLDKDVPLPARPTLSALPRELHLADRPSSTAGWVALGRALELSRPPERRIVSDPFAPIFLTATGRATLAALQTGLPLVHAAERHAVAGLSAYLLCRHRCIDEQLAEGLRDGMEQVLILGAGYDSRAYRFAAELSGRPVHEVDLAPLSRRKAEIVAARPDVFGPTSIRRVETDFRTQSLAENLLASGFAVGARTFVIWEGVAPYLTRESVAATLDALRGLCGSGSVLSMDHWDGVGGTGTLAPVRRLWARSVRLVGEPITFGLRPNAAGEFLDAYGFTLIEQLSAAELARRYTTDARPSQESLYLVTARL